MAGRVVSRQPDDAAGLGGRGHSSWSAAAAQTTTAASSPAMSTRPRCTRPQTAAQLGASIGPKCSVGCSVMDTLLRGGIAAGLVTELVGEATAGKSQLCMQLMLTAQWPVSRGGLGGGSMFIFTEGQAPIKRLNKVIRSHRMRYGATGASVSTDNVLVDSSVSSLQELLATLKKLSVLLYQGRVDTKLLVVDSIANIARDASGQQVSELALRSQELFQVAALLKEIASKYRVAVVVTNQVVDNISELGNAKVLPALGLAWANCVNARIYLCRTTAGDSTAGDRVCRRHLQVVFAPNLPRSQCEFEIREDGTHGIPGTIKSSDG